MHVESYLLDAPSRVCRPIVAHAIGASLSSWPSHMYCFVPYTACIYIYIHIMLIVKRSLGVRIDKENYTIYIVQLKGIEVWGVKYSNSHSHTPTCEHSLTLIIINLASIAKRVYNYIMDIYYMEPCLSM